MALVGHISGSSQSQSVIGVTGSVVFANQPASSFPSLTAVGTDAVFFVSGTIGGKAAGLSKTVAVFGGDTVVSGSLTVGTGSVKITSNDIQFGGVGNRIELNGSDLKFFDASNPSGFTLTSLGSGGGGGPSYWTSIVNNEIFTTGSVVASGSFVVKNSVGASVITLDPVAGGVTGSNFSVTGGTVATTQTTFNLVNDTATTVNFAGAATQLNVGNSAGVVAVAGALQTGGGFGDTGVTLSGAGNVRANGFLQVDGASWLTGSITLAGNSQTITHTGTGDLTIASTAGSVVVEGVTFTGNNVTIPGDLTVSGQVVAIEATNLRVEDAVILLASGTATTSSSKSIVAFASGSKTANSALTFGPVGADDALAVGIQDVQDGTISQASISFASLGKLRASEFQVSTNTAAVKGAGGTITVSGSSVNLHADTNLGVSVLDNSGTPYAKISKSIGDTVFLGTAGNTWFSGSAAFVASDTGSVRIAKGTNSTLELNTDGTTTSTIYSRFADSSPRALVVTASSLALGASTISQGVVFALGGTNTARLSGGSATNFDLRAFQPNATFTLATNGGGSDVLALSGTDARVYAGAAGLKVYRDTAAFVNISSPGANQATFGVETGFTTANVVNVNATTVNFAGAATVLTVGATGATSSTQIRSALTASEGLSVGGVSSADIVTTKTAANLFNTAVTNLNFAGAGTNISVGAAGSGATYLKNASLFVSGATTFGATVLPAADVTYDLGSPTFRWANMYTGDLHLKNDRGDWTIIEEPDFLTITNNRNGKRYKFVMEEIG